MNDGEKLFLNLLVLVLAILYWFTTGHIIPSILGAVIVFLYFFDETFGFVALVLSVLTLLFMIVLLFVDYYNFKEDDDAMKLGLSVLYMVVIYFKSKSIFNAE
ncbi:hypothetical protein [Sulfurimonas sp.]